MFLNLLSYIIIPAYTVLFVKGYSWFTTNFSVIGNLHRRDAFVLWGLLIGLYFLWTLRKILRYRDVTEGRRKAENRLVLTSFVLLFCAVTTPYLPEELPFKSFLHIIFAFLSAVFLLLSLFLIVWRLYLTAPEVYGSYLLGLTVITAGSAALLILIGIVSSALEIFFTISTVVLARRLYGRVRAESKAF